MRSAVLAVAAVALAAGACTTPSDRVAGGAAVGGPAGGATTGRASGALAGAAGGAVVGAATAPPPAAFPCPYGTIRDAAGNHYCR